MKSVDDIPWIDSIPEDWDIYPIFHYFNENKKKNKGMIDNNLLSLSYGKIIQKDIETSFGLLPESFETYQVLEDGYIVLRLTDLQNDKRSLRVGLVTQDGIITSAYVGLKKKRKVYSRYIYQLLHSYDLQKVFYNLGGGLRQSLRFEELKRLPILIPDYETQKQIADFLDKETTRIDTLITKKQKQIELLQEKRQAIITQSVTKGLNPDVKMKDSGVEWIGEIPEHWSYHPVKYSLLSGKDGIRIGPFGSSLKLEQMVPDGYKVYGQENVIKRDFTIGKRYLSNQKFDELNQYEIFPDDILITMMGTTGKVIIVPKEIKQGIMDSHLIRVRFDQNRIINRYFIHQFLESHHTKHQLKVKSKGSIMEGLNSGIIKSMRVTYPPISEQNEIVEYLDSEIGKIDSIKDKIERSINLLKEYRSSLITHAVSGQIDISKYEDLK